MRILYLQNVQDIIFSTQTNCPHCIHFLHEKLINIEYGKTLQVMTQFRNGNQIQIELW